MKKNLILAVCFCLLMGSVAMADSLVFNLSDWKDDKAVKQIAENIAKDLGIEKDNAGEWFLDALSSFQFEFTDAGNGRAALTFDITSDDPDIRNLIGGGDQGLKFKTFGLSGDFKNVFAGSISGWDNGGWTPTTATIAFATGMTWDLFYEGVTSGDIEGSVLAHIQSIGKGGSSINGGVFTFVADGGLSGGPGDPCDIPGMCDGPSPVPEPGSILLLGTGIIGLGLAARRKLGTK